jgi:hypothetical protein
VNKWVFATSVLSHVAGRILFVTLVLLGLIEFVHVLTGTPIPMMDALNAVVLNKLYWAFLLVTTLFTVRLILFRLRDRDMTR